MSKKPIYSKINASGVIWFFALIAIVMQIAILVYDFIRQKTDNVLLIAFLILNMIVIVSLLCTTFDYIRRKIMIEKPTQMILDAREKYSNSSLADLYDELTMPVELRKAHQENDKVVMEAYGFNWKTMTETECVAELMKLYQKLVENNN